MWKMCLLKLVLLLLCWCGMGNSSAEQNEAGPAFPLATNGQPFPWDNMRLPDRIIPIHYDLLVHPNLTTLNFTASVKIEIVVQQETNSIIMHSKDLVISKARLITEDKFGTNSLGTLLQVFEYPPFEQIALKTPELLSASGRYIVHIDYSADLADGFDGFYKSTYKTKDGEIRVIATTDFEPTSARMAFPCFDEPSFKANFSIKIRRESRHIALSNMPKVRTTELEGGLFEDQFDVSVKMSTYLVAFIVCDFKSVSDTTSTGIKDDYFLGVCFGAIARDSLNSSRSISNPAETPTQIKEMFDTVSYDKGACILNMLKDFLTEDVFQSGVVRYLRRHSYGNAKNEDLWSSLVDTCAEEDFVSGGFCYTASQAVKNAYRFAGEHLDIKAMMNTWTLQKGIPLIVVEHNKSTIKVQQERFLKGVFREDPQWASMQSGYLWQVPLTYITSNFKSVGRHLLKTKSDIIELDEEASWVKFNVDMNGYYIVHYEGDGWNHMMQLLDQNHTHFSYKDRTSLIHNAFQLVSAGRLSLDRALDLTRYLRLETHNAPLLQGLGYLEVFYRMIQRRNISDVAENLKSYILQYFKAVIDKQTWSDDGSVSDRVLRSSLLDLACKLGYPPCIQKADVLFTRWMESNGTLSLPTDVLRIVYSVGAQRSVGWSYLLEKYKLSMSSAEKNKFLYGLTTSRDTRKLTTLLELGMQGEVIKTQDLPSLIVTVNSNPVGQTLVWEFVKKNWNKFLEKFQVGSFAIRGILSGITSYFSSKEELEQVEIFFESIRDQGTQLRITQVVLESIQKNIRWMERNLKTLRAWLLLNL
ncbi:endoplasmic reticulum aminopeptidase 2 isoform X2 [Latimeria chalumnae]|uniref:endoplasmic reticulum aminopeptidase 2 isoform X2 n=1 Tax=Latimeria chalumnae TaxID=7897 RepID=UPI00313F226B